MPGAEAVQRNSSKKLIGEYMVEAGLITMEQSEQALSAQKKQRPHMSFGEICVKLRFVQRSDLQRLLRQNWSRVPIGVLLASLGPVTQAQVKSALEQQKRDHKEVVQILIERGILSEGAFINALSVQLGIPQIDPNGDLIDKSVLKRANEAFLRKNLVLPAFKLNGVVTVIMADPLDVSVLRDMEVLYGCKIEPAVARAKDILDSIAQCFPKPSLKPKSEPASPRKDLVIGETRLSDTSDDSYIEIVNYIIGNAILESASDIHIEPQDSFLRIRYRVDGVLHHKTDLPKSIAPGLTSRIKILCKLDIAERRRHQDGRIEACVMGKEVDLRVSTYASVYGESVVIRILRRQTSLMDLDELGFSPINNRRFREILEQPSGIILVTGPTGSGKTTSLYASLNYLKKRNLKIITVEDPVEYTIEGVVQGQLDPKLGLSYSDFLKSMMRQDPDVLMIGEIRDADCARAVIQSALTGHKVFSTFHTDDTTGALLRLMDMGIDAFLISSTVVSVVSQRLIRVLCPQCRQPTRPQEALLNSFHITVGVSSRFTFYEAKGCQHCKGTGFRGRTAIYELLVLNDAIRDAILARKTSTHIRLIARREANLISLREDGFYRASQGVTSLEEVARVAFQNESDDLAPRPAEEIVARCEGKVPQQLVPIERSARARPGSGRRRASAFTSRGKGPLVDGEVFKVRLDCDRVTSERERIADLFDAYQAVNVQLNQPQDSSLLGEFILFITDTVQRLSAAEGAEYVEFALRVQGGKAVILVQTAEATAAKTRPFAREARARQGNRPQ
jgi:type IV pilus assembly protein PilB